MALIRTVQTTADMHAHVFYCSATPSRDWIGRATHPSEIMLQWFLIPPWCRCTTASN